MCNKVYTLDEIRSIAAPIAKNYGVDALYHEMEHSFDKKMDIMTTQMLSDDFLRSIRGEEVLIYERG